MAIAALLLACPAAYAQGSFKPAIPRTWEEKALADWATPLASLKVRPTHLSEADYYAMHVDTLRTYPV